MEKYQEALDYLRWIGGDGYYKKQREKSFDVLQELADKATPMKPRYLSSKPRDLSSRICCGKCAVMFGYSNGYTQAVINYCYNCGQAIDWSEE